MSYASALTWTYKGGAAVENHLTVSLLLTIVEPDLVSAAYQKLRRGTVGVIETNDIRVQAQELMLHMDYWQSCGIGNQFSDAGITVDTSE